MDNEQAQKKVKRRCQKEHAKQRALERYGIKLTKAICRTIAHKILDGKAGLVKQKPGETVATYDVEYVPGVIVRVVYDHQEDVIITFVPR